MMDRWLSYELSDLLMFSPQVYYRQIELANQDVWPVQLITVAGGLLLIMSVNFAVPQRNRIIPAVLAMAWFCAGWGFIASRYSDIHIAGPHIEVLFYLQAAALAACAVMSDGLDIGPRSKIMIRAVTILVLLLLVAYPFQALLSGRFLTSAEVFGVAADPTALVTILIICGMCRGWRLLLAVAPFVWLVFSAMTLWSMGSMEVWIVLAGSLVSAAFMAYGVLLRPGHSSRKPG
jgi:hypothetical protein